MSLYELVSTMRRDVLFLYAYKYRNLHANENDKYLQSELVAQLNSHVASIWCTQPHTSVNSAMVVAMFQKGAMKQTPPSS